MKEWEVGEVEAQTDTKPWNLVQRQSAPAHYSPTEPGLLHTPWTYTHCTYFKPVASSRKRHIGWIQGWSLEERIQRWDENAQTANVLHVRAQALACAGKEEVQEGSNILGEECRCQGHRNLWSQNPGEEKWGNCWKAPSVGKFRGCICEFEVFEAEGKKQHRV